jgi:hypothetical protein
MLNYDLIMFVRNIYINYNTDVIIEKLVCKTMLLGHVFFMSMRSATAAVRCKFSLFHQSMTYMYTYYGALRADNVWAKHISSGERSEIGPVLSFKILKSLKNTIELKGNLLWNSTHCYLNF